MTEKLTFETVLAPARLSKQASDISVEIQRDYYWPDFHLTIHKPVWLVVSASGGHRIVDEDGLAHYVPSGWRHLTWKNKPDAGHIDF